MNWATKRLGDVCEVVPGFAFKSDDLGDQGIPVVKIGSINDDGTVDTEAGQRISPDIISSRHAKYELRNRDILIAMTGATAGKVGRIKCDEDDLMLLNQRVARLTPKSINPDFFWFVVGTPQYRSIFYGLGGGAAQPNMSGPQIEGVEIPCPPPSIQDRIASILSAYDDLIENNRRRIQLLEQAARLLYKEWFVHLRFPGHEHVKITNGAPEGWKIRKLGDITTKIGSGSTPRGGESAYQQSGITLIRSQNIYDYRFDEQGLAYIDDQQADRLSAVSLEPNDILLNITGASVGRCCMVPLQYLPGRVNQHVMIIRIDPKHCSPFFALHTINSHDTKQNLLNIARAGGATREALTKDVVSNTQIRVPPSLLRKQFEDIALTLSAQEGKLEMQNQRLITARDLLLPRLMNGEISV